MESLKDESSSSLDVMAVSSDSMADLEETCPKRICIKASNSNHTVTSPVAAAVGCSEITADSSALELLIDCQDGLSGTPLSSSEGSDDAVTGTGTGTDQCRESQQSTGKHSYSESDNDSCSVNVSDSDVCPRRNLRRKPRADC